METYFKECSHIVGHSLTGYQVIYSKDNWDTIDGFFLDFTKGSNIFNLVRQHMIKIYVDTEFTDIPPQINNDGISFETNMAIDYLYSKHVPIPKKTIIYSNEIFYQTIYDHLSYINNKTLEMVYVYDFLEAPKCQGCRNHIEYGYKGLTKHQQFHGCLSKY